MTPSRSARRTSGATFDQLEPRCLLAAVTWDSGGDGASWHDAANWSGDAVPGADDDVTIDVAGTPTIAFTAASGLRAVRSLLTRENITFSGGEFAVGTTASIQTGATVRASGVVLAGGVWSGPGKFSVQPAANVFRGVAFGEISFDAADSRALLESGTTFTLARLIGQASSIGFTDGAVVTGTIRAEGSSGERYVEMSGNEGQLTFALSGRAERSGGSLIIGEPHWYTGAMALVNEGKLSGVVLAAASTVNRGIFNVNSTFVVSNLVGDLNTVQFVALNRLDLSGNYVINAGLTIPAGTVNLDGAWRNTSVITLTATDSTLNLGGTFTTSGVGVINRTRGTVRITGVLDNTGSVFSLNAATGSWFLGQNNAGPGTIIGGTITSTDGEGLIPSNSTGNLLDGCEIQGGLRFIGGFGSYLRLSADSVVRQMTISNGSLALEAGSELTGDVDFATGTLEQWGTGAAVVITPDATIRSSVSLKVQQRRFSGIETLVNRGTLEGSGDLWIDAAAFVNEGTIRQLTGLTRIYGSWNNTGLIDVRNAALELYGTFTTAGLGSITHAGSGGITVFGELDNTGATLELDASLGDVVLGSLGKITGGRIEQNGGILRFSGATSTLLSVQVAGDLTVGNSATSTLRDVQISGDLAVAEGGTTIVAGTTRFNLLQILGGSVKLASGYVLADSVRFAGTTPGARSLASQASPGGIITIGPSVTVTLASDCASNAGVGTVVMNGHFSSESPGHTLSVTSASGTGTYSVLADCGLSFGQFNGQVPPVSLGERSTFRILAGSYTLPPVLDVGSASATFRGFWSNFGGVITLGAEGTLTCGGTYSTPSIGTIVNPSGGKVIFYGNWDNSNSTIRLNSQTGNWTLGDPTLGPGIITAGSLAQSDGQYLDFAPETDNVLNGVNIPELVLATPAAQVLLTGTFTLGAARLRAAGVVLALPPGVSIQADITIELATGQTAYIESQNGGRLTISPAGSIRSIGAGGLAAVGSGHAYTPFAEVVNEGLLAADGPGAVSNLVAGRFTNNGTVRASGGGRMLFPGVVTNVSGSTLTGGVWLSEPGAELAINGTLTTLNAIARVGTISSFPAIRQLSTINGTFTTIGGGSFQITPTGGTLTVSGTIRVGAGSTLRIIGAAQAGPSAVLEFEIGGTATSQYGRFGVTGGAALDGQLRVSWVAGYTPSFFDSFELVSAGLITGQFAGSAIPAYDPDAKPLVFVGAATVRLVTSTTADFNEDGEVDFFDYLDFAMAFDGSDGRADFDHNGQVDFFDYLDFIRVLSRFL